MEKQLNKTSLKVNFIFNTFLQILSTIAPLITAPYVSRVLGPDNIGIYSYTLSINSYFVLIAGLGTASYGIIEIAKARDSTYDRSKTFWGIELITVITSVVSLILWFFIVLFYDEYRFIFFIQTFYILAIIFDISWFFLGIEKLKHTVIINSFFKIMGVIFIFLFVKTPNDLSIYILILALSTFLGNTSMWIFLPKYIVKSKVTQKDLLAHCRGTLIYFVPTIAATIYTVVDKTLIGIITKDNIENGCYEQATKIISIIRTISFTSMNTLFSSRMSYLFSKNMKKEIQFNLSFALEFIMTLSFGAFFGLCAVSKCIVPVVFGEGYSRVVIFLILMSLLIPIMGISNTIGYLYYNPSGNRAKSAKILIFGTLINCILNVCLIKLFSGIGAIIASVIAEFIITYLYIKQSDGYISFNQMFKIISKKLISGILMLMTIIVISKYLVYSILSLIIEICLGVIIYYLGLIVLKDTFALGVTKKMFVSIQSKIKK